MDRHEIEERVKNVIAQVLKVDEAMIESDSHFVFDLGAESTQSVELVAAFEGEFDIDMDEEEALKVQTVDAAVEYISRCLQKSEAIR